MELQLKEFRVKIVEWRWTWRSGLKVRDFGFDEFACICKYGSWLSINHAIRKEIFKNLIDHILMMT